MGSQFNVSYIESAYSDHTSFASTNEECDTSTAHNIHIPIVADQDGRDLVPDEYKHVDIDDGLVSVSPEDAILSRIDQSKVRDTIALSIDSALARSTDSVTKLAPMGCDFIDYLDEIGKDVECLKCEREIHVRLFSEADKIAHAKDRLFGSLRPSLTNIIQLNENCRDQDSWRAEVAAVIVASYGKMRRIPKAIWHEIQAAFGSRVLELASDFRSKITRKEAKKWLANVSIRRSVCECAGLDPKLVLHLAAKI